MSIFIFPGIEVLDGVEKMNLWPGSKVVENLFRKRDLLLAKKEEHKKIRPLILTLGGAMQEFAEPVQLLL